MEVISKLTIAETIEAINDAGLHARRATLAGLGIPCAMGSRDGLDFQAYVQEGQSLCFQATIPFSVPGYTDVTNNWNGFQRFSKAMTVKEGYLMRFEADISHGITRGNLNALVRKFGEAIVTFRAMYLRQV